MRQPPGLPPRPAPSRRRGTTAATVVRAMLSFLMLAGLLAGLPVVLWWGTSIVAAPGIAALGNLLSTQDTGQVFLLALAVAAWVGWALFAASVLLEIGAQLRGRTAPRMRLLIGQRAAATLVGAVLLALPTGTALASPTPAHAVSQTATPHPGASVTTAAVTTAAAADDQHEGARTVAYTVREARPAESLWSIAEQQLGDGSRWEEIAHLNQGHTMADGTVFDASHVIQPGWVLQLPADANTPTVEASTHVDSGRAGQPEHSGPAVYTVKSGDNLSQIAQNELGDATQYPELFHLNEGEPQPGGGHFTDPDLIIPGQELTLPATQAADPHHTSDSHRPAADGAADGNQDSGHHSTPTPTATAPAPSDTPSAQPTSPANPTTSPPQAPSSTPTHTATTPPAASATQQPTTTPTPAPSETTAPSATAAPAHTTSPKTTPLQRMVWAGGIAALLAAGLLGSLGIKRILQQRRRRAGETIAIDPDPTQLEQVLHASAEPASVTRLDLALRTLAHHAATSGTDLPTVRGAQVTDRTVHLLIDDPTMAPMPPFTAGPRDGCWTLDPTAQLLDADAAQDVPAPYSGLLTLGATDAGHLLLANLLHSRALLLDGDDEDILAVARAMALEAATSGWSDHTEIITIGLGARLATLLPQGRIRTMPHLPAVIADLGALLVEVHQQTDGPEPLPWMLICATDVDPEHAWHLADAVSSARGLPVSVVLPACDATRSLWPDADTLPVTPEVKVTLHQLAEEPITVQRLTDEQYRQYLHALQVADQPAQPATDAWQRAADHNHAATTAPPEPVPILLQAIHADDSDPGDPFPALLASTEGRIRLVKPTPPPDEDAEQSDDQPVENATADTGTSPTTAPEAAAPALSPASDATDEEEDPNAPEINVLGPIEATGITSSGHGPKVAALAALILLRPGRSADTLCTSMDPLSPWSPRTLQSRLSEIRSRFGNDPHGNPYLPRPRGGYAFAIGVRSDWARFQRLATRALAAGPDSGKADLEAALALVRARPFDGADYPWADAIQQEMISRIIDVAHTLATWHTQGPTPDLDAARHAVLRGLDTDKTAEVLYRDWLLIEHTAGNQAGVRKVIARVHQVTRAYDIDMDPLTEHTINHVLNERPNAAQAGRL